MTGSSTADYVAHHAWFQYYASTANPTHARPNSTKSIGYTMIPGKNKADPANHAYDIADFTTAVSAGNFPAVTFIKQPAFQDGHAGYSDPLDEQTGLVNLINFLQQQPDWDSTAVIIAYDDSDGWYDHASPPSLHPSFSASDVLDGAALCGVSGTTQPPGINGMPVMGRCGPGTRQPFLVISPYAKKNYVSHTLTTRPDRQFIEDNWLTTGTGKKAVTQRLVKVRSMPPPARSPTCSTSTRRTARSWSSTEPPHHRHQDQGVEQLS